RCTVRRPIDPTLVAEVLDSRLPLSADLPVFDYARNLEQRRAAEHLTLPSGSIGVVVGAAGTGKSFDFGVVREIAEQSGEIVIGVCPSGPAARRLQESSGIKSDTLDLLLTKLSHANKVYGIVSDKVEFRTQPTKAHPDGELLLGSNHRVV